MAPPFVPARDQDAWGSIRGFVYQVSVTIARWLALGADEALLLECGEDIDHIAAAFAATDDRLLEQIKVRAGALSLRTALALQGLANAVDQRRANPSIGLRFRFTTTAAVAREQGHPDPDQAPGIEVWERLRTGSDRETEDLALLHGLLDGAQRPASVPETTWANAASEFADVTGLLSLVKVFEWAMATPSLDDQSAQVIRSLVSEGHAPLCQHA